VPAHVVDGRDTTRPLRRWLLACPVRDASIPLNGGLADRVHTAKVLTAVGFDDDRRVNRRRLIGLPKEELAAIAFELDFYDLSWH
jgi:hypothetical protein